MKRSILIACFAVVLLSACSSQTGGGADIAVEQYIRALAEKDKAQITALSCASWEESAILEVDALLSVEAEVKDISCSVTGEEGANSLVVCNGSLDLTYNDEIRGIDLSLRTYYLQQVDGQWKVCEYR